MKKKAYVAPETEMRTVELEQGVMAASVYEKPENTESLNIENQKVSDDVFDFSGNEKWEQ